MINNIERVANLFITKAAYAVLLTALVGIAGSPFPFLARQLTLIGSFSIGLGFFLALALNESLVRPGFLERCCASRFLLAPSPVPSPTAYTSGFAASTTSAHRGPHRCHDDPGDRTYDPRADQPAIEALKVGPPPRWPATPW